MIRKRRLDMSLMQSDVAQIIGCDLTSVLNWEKERSNPSVNHMAGIVRFLGFNPLPTGSSIGERLVAHRKARGITQKEFAHMLGVDPSTLAKWERGEREPRGRFEKIAAAALSRTAA